MRFHWKIFAFGVDRKNDFDFSLFTIDSFFRKIELVERRRGENESYTKTFW